MPNENNIQETVQNPSNWRYKLINAISLIVIGFGTGWLVGLSVTPVVSIIITSIVGVAATLLTVISGLKAWTPESEESETTDEPQKLNNSLNVTPIPIAIFIVGILLGSGLGVFARTHNWLGSQLFFEVKKWTDIGLDKKEVAQRLLDSEYPTSSMYSHSWSSSDLAAEIKKWTDAGLDKQKVAQQIFNYEYSKRTLSSETSVETPAKSPTGSESSTQPKSGVLFGAESDECDNLLTFTIDKLPGEIKFSAIPEIQELPNIVQEPEALKQVLEIICKISTKSRP